MRGGGDGGASAILPRRPEVPSTVPVREMEGGGGGGEERIMRRFMQQVGSGDAIFARRLRLLRFCNGCGWSVYFAGV